MPWLKNSCWVNLLDYCEFTDMNYNFWDVFHLINDLKKIEWHSTLKKSFNSNLGFG